MTIYNSLDEVRAAVKKATGKAPTKYVLNGREVSASEYRGAEGSESFYRSGFFAVAGKTTVC